MNKKLANAFAFSAAAVFLSGCAKGGETGGADAPAVGGGETAAKVKCLGINECKGQAQCDTATHSCAGQNECKGKGWILVPQAECDSKGGSIKQ